VILFDLDDVTARFTDRVNEIHGSNHKIGDTMLISEWDHIRENHQRIFRELEPYEEMVDFINNQPKFNTAILTALPFDHHSPWQYAAMDKVVWCQKYLPGAPVFFGIFAHDKWKHCKPGDLLIDDRQSNCEEWVAAGGKALLYRGDVGGAKIWVRGNS